MTAILLRVLILASVGLALVLLVRRPVQRLFGAGPAFTLWLLPWVMMAAAWLPLPWHAAPPAVIATMLAAPADAAYVVSAGAVVHVAPVVWPVYAAIGVWLFGVALGLARLMMQYVMLRRDMRPVPPDMRKRLRSMCSPADMRRLRLHRHGPAVAWAPRTRVLLPVDFLDRFGASACRMVLRHELAHARHGDAWWALAAELTRALLWFHPLAWWASSRFRLDMELACDERTLRASPDGRATYGRALLDSVAARAQPTVIPWLTVTQLKARMALIAHAPIGRMRRTAGVATTVALLLGALVGSSVVMGTPAYELPSTSTPYPASAASAGSSAVIGTTMVAYPPRGRLKIVQMRPALVNPAHERGKVMIKATVDAAGRVTHIAIDRTATKAPEDLQQATLHAVRKWKFRLTASSGKAVAGAIRVPIVYGSITPGDAALNPAAAASSSRPVIILLPVPASSTAISQEQPTTPSAPPPAPMLVPPPPPGSTHP